MLPIDSSLPELLAALETNRRVVLEAPPGAGKTTGVPLAVLGAPWLGGGKIVMLEPRRLAARAAATRMARVRGEDIGKTLGYRIRGDTRVGPVTRIEVVTEGVLTRMLQDDAALEGVSLVIFDEFHERSLVADTGLALTLATAELLRDDLRILVMSATLDGNAVASLMGGAPVIRSSGRAFPVETRYRPMAAGARIAAHVAGVIRESVESDAGSILVFLPGAGEIRRVAEQLAGTLPSDVGVHQLFGAMPPALQDAAIAPLPPGRRKVVLATNVAETSLTIEGIEVVIDGGFMRVPRFAARTGMTRLETIRISRASADQRRGRAGRVMPGVCYRCWHRGEEGGFVPFTRAEILEADLTGLALDIAIAGFPDPSALRWLDPPPAAAFAQARALLTLLGALDRSGHVTDHGRAVARLGTHPRLAHMLVRAQDVDPPSAARAAALVGLLDDRDPLRGEAGMPPSDITLRLDAIEGRRDARAIGTTLDRGLVARAQDAAREWRRRLGTIGSDTTTAADPGTLLALAYPDRVAQQRGGPGRFLLRNGRGASLPVHDALAHAAWIVAADLDDTGSDARIMLAAPLDPASLLAHASEQVEVREDVSWDASSASVRATRRTMLGALVLGEHAMANPDADRVADALRSGIRSIGVAGLPWSASATALRERIAFCGTLEPTWPDVSDAGLLDALDTWLGRRIEGIRRLADMQRIDFSDALSAMLSWDQRRAIDELAPERIQVPTGSMIRVDYTDPTAPFLAVRLQEVFGMRETPRVGRGRVPVVMHLLSPAQRPVQVTRDLESFWRSGYFDVRKDLRGRYPKHHWPEDPLEAKAVRGVKRRETRD